MIIAILGFIAFIIAFLGVLMGAHFLLYISIIRFFSITNGSARVYLLSILLFLVRQAKPGQSSELKGAHHVVVRLTCSCPIAGRGNLIWCEASRQRRREP